jgi:hypothetical protein
MSKRDKMSHMKYALFFSALSAVGSGVSVMPAQAQQASTQLNAILNDVTCEQSEQRLAPSLLRERLIVGAGMTFDRDTLNALETNTLGSLAATRSNGALAALLTQVTDFLAPTTPILLGAEARFLVQRSDAAQALPPRDVAIAFINGDADMVAVTCMRPSAPPAPVPVPPPKPRTFIVADSKSDLIKVPRDRAFATIGFEDDRIAGTSLFNVSVALAREPMRLRTISPTAQLNWTPFVQYNRRTAPAGRDQVNDLTLGSSFILRNPLRVGGAVGFASLAYQTDDDTEAQVWVGDALVDFPRVAFCTRRDIIGWDMRCNLSFVMDYADVNDPGASTRLATLDRYLRVGTNMSLVTERRFPIGLVTVNMNYTGRYDTLSGEATGDLFSISAGLRPTQGSNFSLEARYTVGTTLNTLVGVDKISVRLGYRM